MRNLSFFVLGISVVEDSPFKKRRGLYQGVVYNVIKRFQSQFSESGKVEKELEEHEANKTPSFSSSRSELEDRRRFLSGIDSDSSSGDEDTGDGKWKLDLAWLTKALEPAIQLRRWALPTGLYHMVSCSRFDSWCIRRTS